MKIRSVTLALVAAGAASAAGIAAYRDLWPAPAADGKATTALEYDGAPKDRIGLAVRALTPGERREADGSGGLIVEDVGGFALRSGVKPGDIVLSLDGDPVTNAAELHELTGRASTSVALLVERSGARIFIPIDEGSAQ